MLKANQRRKIVWTIKFNKRNIVRFSFFCFFGIQIVALFIWAFVLVVTNSWRPTNRFLVAFPIFLSIIDLFIGKNIIMSSQPED